MSSSLSPSPSPSFLPPIIDNDLDVKFSLKLNYEDFITITEGESTFKSSLQRFKNNIKSEICSLLEVSPYRIIINKVLSGSIIIEMTIKKTKYDTFIPVLVNDNKYSIDLYDILYNYLTDPDLKSILGKSNSLLESIDVYTITKNKESFNRMNINNIIPKQLSFIDNLIKTKKPFKMYTLVSKEGIYPPNTVVNPSDNKLVKLYLTVNNKNNTLSKCSFEDGLLELREEDEITTNSIFTLSEVSPRSIVKENKPFKYIDFVNSYVDEKTKVTLVQSQFYNLQIYKTNQSITYCSEGCADVNSFCAQNDTLSHVPSIKNGYLYEKIKNTHSNQLNLKDLKLTTNGLETNILKLPTSEPEIKKHSLDDTYNIKNYMKLKIEDEKNMIVTPYFISKNPIERIYFLTNKYNILNQKLNYKKLIQVPKYIDESNLGEIEKPYYEMPVYKNNLLTIEKQLITGLNDVYPPNVLQNYKNKKSMTSSETLAFSNLAYQKYSLQFTIELITEKEIKKLPKK